MDKFMKQLFFTLAGLSVFVVAGVLFKIGFDLALFISQKYVFNLQNFLITVASMLVLVSANRIGEKVVENVRRV
jgi:5-bromo-4-chloroindolyl phosphate hydrolysis protein